MDHTRRESSDWVSALAPHLPLEMLWIGRRQRVLAARSIAKSIKDLEHQVAQGPAYKGYRIVIQSNLAPVSRMGGLPGYTAHSPETISQRALAILGMPGICYARFFLAFSLTSRKDWAAGVRAYQTVWVYQPPSAEA